MKKSVIDVVAVAECILGLMDLTTLNDDDSVSRVTHLCHQAKSPAGNTAAVCIFPRFIPVARKVLHEQGTPEIRIATVVNFPQGNDDVEIALAETRAAVAYGADEVDLVFPYRSLMAGNDRAGYVLVQACQRICADSNVLLKVIIETGELKQASLIRRACEIAIDAGADFLKTSTGKVALNATLPAAEIMLSVIRERGVHEQVGFKAAGGIRTLADAAAFLQLAENMMGKAWINPRHLRFGASSLLSDLLVVLGYQG